MRIKQREYNRVTNQIHTPLKKTKEQLGHEEQKCKMYFKSGNSSMLICKNMSKLASQCLAEYIERYIKQHGSKLEGVFIYTR